MKTLFQLAAVAALAAATLPFAAADEPASSPTAQAPTLTPQELQEGFLNALKRAEDIDPYLAQGVDVNGILYYIGERYTPLFFAAATHTFGECGGDPICTRSKASEYHTRTLRRLLELGADPNLPSNRYYLLTPLMAAAASGSLENVKLLVENGARVNQANSSGATALSYAVTNNHLDVARYLISQGADVNTPGTGEYGEAQGRRFSQLHVAAAKRFAEMVKLLLKSGADRNVKDLHGNTPEIWAYISTNIFSESNAPNELTINAFSYTETEKPAALPTLPQLTPLMAAAYAGDIPAMEKLLTDGADVDEKNAEGATALSWAVAGGHMDAARLLLHCGASPHVPATDMYYRAQALRFTLLHAAALQQREDIVHLLLAAYGSAPTQLKATDAYGLTPGAWLFGCAQWNTTPPGGIILRSGSKYYNHVKARKQRLLDLLPANIPVPPARPC